MGASGGGDANATHRAWTDAHSDAGALATEDGIIVGCNPALPVILGAKGRDVVGSRMVEIIAPGSLALFAGGGPAWISLMRDDGVEVEVAWSRSQITDGERTRSLHVFRPRPEAEFRNVRASGDGGVARTESVYQLVFDHIPVGLLHFDARGVIIACNDAFVKIIGSSRSRLIGLNTLTLTDPQMVAAVRATLRGERAHYEGDYRSVTATKVTSTRVIFAPVHDTAGAVIGGVGIVEDITARRDAEIAVRQSEIRVAQADRLASVGILAAGVAHEINNPLAYVVTSLDHAQSLLEAARVRGGDGVESDPRLIEALQKPLASAREGVERVRLIVRDLRTFSRSETAADVSIDVERTMDTAINLASVTTRARARLLRDYGGVGPVTGDPSRLGQVFVNLLVNAAQAIPEGHAEHNEIRVLTREVHGTVSIEVSDTGEGMSLDVAHRVFEPFVTSKPPGEGTGLGLSICHGIVKSMGGEITLEHTGPDGTTFRVCLPRARDEHPAKRVATPPVSADLAPTPSLRVLVIDDEAVLASTLRLALSDRHEVLLASSGTDGLAVLARDQAFDVVLCDLLMPDRTGIDVFEAIERDHPALAPRVVFMTGGTYTSRAEALFARVKNLRLEKPFSMEELNAVLRKMGSVGDGTQSRA